MITFIAAGCFIFCAYWFFRGYWIPIIIGGIAGSFFGLAGSGGAISFMLPGAAIGAWLAVSWKKNKMLRDRIRDSSPDR